MKKLVILSLFIVVLGLAAAGQAADSPIDVNVVLESANPNLVNIFDTPDGGIGHTTSDMAIVPTPLPASLLLLGSGLIGMLGIGLRRSRS